MWRVLKSEREIKVKWIRMGVCHTKSGLGAPSLLGKGKGSRNDGSVILPLVALKIL